MPKAKPHELDEAFSYGCRAANTTATEADCPYAQRDMARAWKGGFKSRKNEIIQANTSAIGRH